MDNLSDLAAVAYRDVTIARNDSGGRTIRRNRLALLRRAARCCLIPLAKVAARAYVAGDRLQDGQRVASRHTEAGRTTTLGFFNEDNDPPRQVADTYLATIKALSGTSGYVSIKLPAIGFSQALLAEVAQQAKTSDLSLHFDAMWPAATPTTLRMIEQMTGAQACGPLGLALPGRWRRSVDDARWTTDRGLFVRVVKGQWADPDDPHRDLRQGFMEVIRALAGRKELVAVASHDTPLAEQAIRVLQEAHTPCELELLHGLPMRPSLAMAQRLGVKVRVYVPFGQGHLPYAIAKMIHNPHLAWWLVRDLLGLAG